jgi:hypothetical protein
MKLRKKLRHGKLGSGDSRCHMRSAQAAKLPKFRSPGGMDGGFIQDDNIFTKIDTKGRLVPEKIFRQLPRGTRQIIPVFSGLFTPSRVICHQDKPDIVPGAYPIQSLVVYNGGLYPIGRTGSPIDKFLLD